MYFQIIRFSSIIFRGVISFPTTTPSPLEGKTATAGIPDRTQTGSIAPGVRADPAETRPPFARDCECPCDRPCVNRGWA